MNWHKTTKLNWKVKRVPKLLRVFCSIGFQTSRNVIKVKKTSAFSSKEIADIVRALGKENEDSSKTLFVGVKTNDTKWWLEQVSPILRDLEVC